MNTTRREFIKSVSGTAAFATMSGPLIITSNLRRKKLILSFYLDDTSPEIVPATAYRDFLNYCQAEGIKGEASFIPGYSGQSVTRNPNPNQRLYIEQVRMAYEKGIDTHMEIMTHDTLFNFNSGKKSENGIHEGLWLHEPRVTSDEYHLYFRQIINEALKAGIKFTGLTWPGCGCEACTKRYAELKNAGPLHLNQPVFDALLKLAKDGMFRNRVLPIFYESDEKNYGIFKRAADGQYGVYDLMPNANDKFGIWENSAEHVDPDYYITEDGKSGIILQHMDDNAPYCMWYMHWQGLNPGKGVGWEAFKTVTGRIRQHLANKVIWMRPGDIVTSYHDAGSWKFVNNL